MFEPRSGKYICHATPAGTVQNPTRDNCRFSATREDLFPADRDVKLDITFLKKMRLFKQRMLEYNELFFYQLILPIVDPAMSGIDGNTRMGYYKDVTRNTNMYAFGVKNRGGKNGHVFHPTTAEELLVWNGIVCHNINTSIAESWVMNQSNTFDQEIMEAMHFRRWLNIKACLKQNVFWTEKKNTEEGDDPMQKHRLVWDVMTHYMNQLIDKGGLDLTTDETKWPN
jgi:hypothetical protein